MSDLAPATFGFEHPKPRRLTTATLLWGVLALGGVLAFTATYISLHDGKKTSASKAVSTAFCGLTSEATPTAGGVGFTLKAQCPGGTKLVQPNLSLWIQLVEALPDEKRLVLCTVRGKDDLADCRRKSDFARSEQDN